MGQLRKQDRVDRHELVECPACKTKFAIESHVIASYETPRFHCSRCDHIFERERRPEPGMLVKHDIDDISQYLGTSAERAPTGAGSAGADEGEVFPAARQHHSPSVPGFDVPRMFEPTAPASAPQEPAAVCELSGQQLELDFESKKAAALPPKPIVQEIKDKKAESEGVIARETAPGTTQASKSVSSVEPTGDQGYLLPELDLGEPPPSLLERIGGLLSSFAPKGGGLAYIVSPLMIFFVGLLGFSYYCQTNPAAAIELSTKILPGAPSIAPPGVHIKRSRFRKAMLDNGESVGIISGTIVNGSDRPIRDVLIEGLLFGSNGDQATSVKVMLGADLSKTRLKSLTIDMIEQLQAGQGARRIELKPEREADFTIAFPDAELDSVDYFAARIYSVR